MDGAHVSRETKKKQRPVSGRMSSEVTTYAERGRAREGDSGMRGIKGTIPQDGDI